MDDKLKTINDIYIKWMKEKFWGNCEATRIQSHYVIRWEYETVYGDKPIASFQIKIDLECSVQVNKQIIEAEIRKYAGVLAWRTNG